jgi:branched-chain amino acid transport system ATP-binding protein
MPGPMLAVEGLETAYGQSQVLFGVSLRIAPGEVATLLGRNGMGKTTTVRSIMGMVRSRAGSIAFDSAYITGLPSYRIAQAGIGLVPEGRQIFPNLTVRENLVATAANRRNAREPWTLERVFGLFGILKGRSNNYGNQLSGGEQQMLAIGRALMVNPRLLLLDEPMEGLAPIIVQELMSIIRDLVTDSGMAVIVVEQHAKLALSLTRQAVVLERGRVVHRAASEALLADPATLHRLVAVA